MLRLWVWCEELVKVLLDQLVLSIKCNRARLAVKCLLSVLIKSTFVPSHWFLLHKPGLLGLSEPPEAPSGGRAGVLFVFELLVLFCSESEIIIVRKPPTQLETINPQVSSLRRLSCSEPAGSFQNFSDFLLHFHQKQINSKTTLAYRLLLHLLNDFVSGAV